jgi:hypothetical protein
MTAALPLLKQQLLALLLLQLCETHTSCIIHICALASC